jgi:hypothetical protein
VRSVEDDGWEAAYWDDYAAEFGTAALIEARYTLAPQPKGRDMEFIASISGTTTVTLDTEGLTDDIVEALANYGLDNVEDLVVENAAEAEVSVEWTGSYRGELDNADVEQLVRERIEAELGSVDVSVDSVEEV